MTQPDLSSTALLDDAIGRRLLSERVIVLGREVDDALANRIVAQLLLLAAEDEDADITLYINSPGGSVLAGLAVYDTMQSILPDVRTVGMGLAASMGQFLLTAGAPGKRFVLPHTDVLLHQPHGGLGGTQSDVVIRARAMGHFKRRIAELTAEHTGQTVEQITADADRDRWFTARQAVDYGLVDQVLPPGNTRVAGADGDSAR
jgi:ATP-dependent Clp protease protease subunit